MHVDDSILLEILLYLEGSFVPPRTVSHHGLQCGIILVPLRGVLRPITHLRQPFVRDSQLASHNSQWSMLMCVPS
jgi:hypothetical protein